MYQGGRPKRESARGIIVGTASASACTSSSASGLSRLGFGLKLGFGQI